MIISPQMLYWCSFIDLERMKRGRSNWLVPFPTEFWALCREKNISKRYMFVKLHVGTKYIFKSMCVYVCEYMYDLSMLNTCSMRLNIHKSKAFLLWPPSSISSVSILFSVYFRLFNITRIMWFWGRWGGLLQGSYSDSIEGPRTDGHILSRWDYG